LGNSSQLATKSEGLATKSGKMEPNQGNFLAYIKIPFIYTRSRVFYYWGLGNNSNLEEKIKIFIIYAQPGFLLLGLRDKNKS